MTTPSDRIPIPSRFERTQGDPSEDALHDSARSAVSEERRDRFVTEHPLLWHPRDEHDLLTFARHDSVLKEGARGFGTIAGDEEHGSVHLDQDVQEDAGLLGVGRPVERAEATEISRDRRGSWGISPDEDDALLAGVAHRLIEEGYNLCSGVRGRHLDLVRERR